MNTKTYLMTALVVSAVGIGRADLRFAKSGVTPDDVGYWWFQSAENWWTNAQYSAGAPNPAHFPTKDDNVYINSPLLTDSSLPLYIKDGDVVETKELTINYGRNGWGSSGRWQYFDFNGGTMVNYGSVRIGTGGGNSYGYALVNFRRGTWDVRGTLTVGSAVDNQPVSMGVVNISSEAKLMVTNAEFRLGDRKGTAIGVVTNEGVVLYKNLVLCTDGMQHGLYVMRGGTNYNSACASSALECLQVGGTSAAWGTIRGWGYWDRGGDTAKNKGNIRMKHYGRIIADGEGAERDLNMGWFQTVNNGVTSEANWTGTNGWFAVNKGRLVYPHRHEWTGTSIARNLGDGRDGTTWEAPSDMINTVFIKGSHSLATAHTIWPYLQLYASDRSDIPELATVAPKHKDGKWLGVFRIGFFSKADNSSVDPTSGNKDFDTMSVKFRYDHQGLKAQKNPKITLYRYVDGEGWIELASQNHDAASPYIAAENLAKRTVTSTDHWNLGWFAIKADYEDKGLVLIVN